MLRMEFESKTVWAETADDAIRLYLEGQGSPAETWGPLDTVAAAAEMGTPEAERMHLDAKHWLTGAVPDEDWPPDSPLPDRTKL